MKKINISFEQYVEFEKQVKTRDVTYGIVRDLEFLSSICPRDDKEEILKCIICLERIRDNAIDKLDEMMERRGNDE